VIKDLYFIHVRDMTHSCVAGHTESKRCDFGISYMIVFHIYVMAERMHAFHLFFFFENLFGNKGFFLEFAFDVVHSYHGTFLCVNS